MSGGPPGSGIVAFAMGMDDVKGHMMTGLLNRSPAFALMLFRELPLLQRYDERFREHPIVAGLGDVTGAVTLPLEAIQDGKNDSLTSALRKALLLGAADPERCLPLPSKAPATQRAKRDSVEKAKLEAEKALQSIVLTAMEDASKTASANQQPSKRELAIRSLMHSAGILSSETGISTEQDPATDKRQLSKNVLAYAMSSASLQRWMLVEAIIHFCTKQFASQGHQEALLEILAILSALALSDHNTCYRFPEKSESPLAYSVLEKLAQIGLVYRLLLDKEKWFLPTQELQAALAATHQRSSTSSASATLGHDAAASKATASADDTIITETNFRVYAYTTNETTLRILKQFADDEVHLPGFHGYSMKRDSFRNALKNGLSASQIIRFLELKAHPVMLAAAGRDHTGGEKLVGGSRKEVATTKSSSTNEIATSTIIPQSIVDQLNMWQRECSRLTMDEECVLLSAPNPATVGKIVEAVRRSYAAAVDGQSSLCPSITRFPPKDNHTGSNGKKRPREDEDHTEASTYTSITAADRANGLLFVSPLQVVVRRSVYQHIVKPLIG